MRSITNGGRDRGCAWAASLVLAMGIGPLACADCPADMDGDAWVAFGDLLHVLGAWGGCAGCPEDLDGDLNVGFSDVLVLLGEWGPCAIEAGPPNDDCADAVAVPLGSVVLGSTIEATYDGAPLCGTSYDGPGIWYSCAGTGNRMTASTCGVFYDYDTVVSVYCGPCDGLTCIAGNDDYCIGGANGYLSTASWCSAEGAEYLILVHGFGGATGDFQLTLIDDGLACPGGVICQ